MTSMRGWETRLRSIRCVGGVEGCREGVVIVLAVSWGVFSGGELWGWGWG